MSTHAYGPMHCGNFTYITFHMAMKDYQRWKITGASIPPTAMTQPPLLSPYLSLHFLSLHVFNGGPRVSAPGKFWN